MHELVAFWDGHDEDDVSAELTRLFVLQDRTLGTEKRTLLIRELSASGLPAKAVIAGIKKLSTENISQIKFATILEASREFVDQKTASAIENCEDCNKRGRIVAIDDKHRYYALRCRCSNRNQFNDLKPWNGSQVFFSSSRELTVI